jgi:glycogen synthase
MKVLLLTNEYPPFIYGGAGVHIDNLSRALARLCPVEVRCFGDQQINAANLVVRGYHNMAPGKYLTKSLNKVHDTLQRCIHFNSDNIDADIVHVHTWYTHFAGIMAKLNYSVPLVLTTHSLEPLRPWKRDQLGPGYNFSTWVEKTAIEMADAVVAVSQETKENILKHFAISPKKIHVIPNGIDPDVYKPMSDPEALKRWGVDPQKPYVLFVGRITRQKGIIHLVNAIKYFRQDLQVVLCAGAPDTPAIAQEMETLVKKARQTHGNIHWIKEMVDQPSMVALYAHAAVFCCPSVYEPFGIINIEAMACETPVVATAVGGIKEVVQDHKTGYLVPVKLKDGSHEPIDPQKLSKDLAAKINALTDDPSLGARMGRAGRQRVLDHYTWQAVARLTFDLYKTLLQ